MHAKTQGKDSCRKLLLRALAAFCAALLLGAASCSALSEGSDAFPLNEDAFALTDIPTDYLTPASQTSRVEKLRYITSDEEKDVKSVMVYLPCGYDETDAPYNVLYILHGAGSSVKNYLNTERMTEFQCLLDHMIENGELAPMIVVAATYYPEEGPTKYLPLAEQVKVAASFPRELVEDILPKVAENYRTYAASSSLADIAASRAHRAIAGFSLGGTATWYVFLQQMQAFQWFMPISEASWDDGEGGTSGIWDSDLSARVLYDAVLEQGYGKNDFDLFVATGTEDEAFEVSTNQMISLLAYADLFMPGENTTCSMIIGGTHTLSALYTYLYHILPSLFGG